MYYNNPNALYEYVYQHALRENMCETICALETAWKLHNGQLRKSGEPYIVHPLIMARDAIGLNLNDDLVIAVILLHDVVEDCDVDVESMPVCAAVQNSVKLLTFSVMDRESKEAALTRYYRGIIQDRAATLTKLLDRCHNVSSMAGVFPKDKLNAYIDETRRYVLPLLNQANEKYPEDAGILFVLEYHIRSVIDAIEEIIRQYENPAVDHIWFPSDLSI